MDTIDKALFEKACHARLNAYAPYSSFYVGACIETSQGKLYSGCNVENASYGLTTCAEASAISAMIASGETTIRQIAIVTDSKKPAGPCGACRQRIYEFAESESITVHLFNLNKLHVTKQLNELLPFAFGPGNLDK